MKEKSTGCTMAMVLLGPIPRVSPLPGIWTSMLWTEITDSRRSKWRSQKSGQSPDLSPLAESLPISWKQLLGSKLQFMSWIQDQRLIFLAHLTKYVPIPWTNSSEICMDDITFIVICFRIYRILAKPADLLRDCGRRWPTLLFHLK